MARSFLAASPYRDIAVDDSALRQVFQNLIAQGCVIVNERGFIAGMLTPLFFAPGITIATELAWWAPGADGTKLRELFEEWARNSGASAVQMSALNNEHASRLTGNLSRNGYTPIEVSYLKAI